MTARGAWDLLSTTIVSAAAVTMVGLYLHDRTRAQVPSEPDRVFADDWQEWENSGLRIGSEDATMVVAGFMDFTCPYCRMLVPVLDSLMSEFPGDVSIQFQQFPLDGHAFSLPSAVAAECADRQGRFPQMYRVLYDQMDSLGAKPWESLAAEAGVPDIPSFNECARLPSNTFDRIAAGRALGERLGVRGTPTLWVNGSWFMGRSLAGFRQRARELGL